MMKDIFEKTVSEEIIKRIDLLQPDSKANWGKMTVDQMLAHCNIAYEQVYNSNLPKPSAFKKWMLKTFIKNLVVSEKPFKKNGRTAPEFLVTNEKDFKKEKEQLKSYITKTQELGENYFDNRESHSLGKLTKTEWSNMFYKHLDHHLNQFDV